MTTQIRVFYTNDPESGISAATYDCEDLVAALKQLGEQKSFIGTPVAWEIAHRPAVGTYLHLWLPRCKAAIDNDHWFGSREIALARWAAVRLGE